MVEFLKSAGLDAEAFIAGFIKQASAQGASAEQISSLLKHLPQISSVPFRHQPATYRLPEKLITRIWSEPMSRTFLSPVEQTAERIIPLIRRMSPQISRALSRL